MSLFKVEIYRSQFYGDVLGGLGFFKLERESVSIKLMLDSL